MLTYFSVHRIQGYFCWPTTPPLSLSRLGQWTIRNAFLGDLVRVLYLRYAVYIRQKNSIRQTVECASCPRRPSSLPSYLPRTPLQTTTNQHKEAEKALKKAQKQAKAAQKKLGGDDKESGGEEEDEEPVEDVEDGGDETDVADAEVTPP